MESGDFSYPSRSALYGLQREVSKDKRDPIGAVGGKPSAYSYVRYPAPVTSLPTGIRRVDKVHMALTYTLAH